MNKSIAFTIPGKPGAKGRPRFQKIGGFVKPYTPEETYNFENLVKLYYRDAAIEAGIDMDIIPKGMFRIDIVAYFEITASKPKAWKELAAEGAIRPTSRPDWDNIGKIVSDALNDIAWIDDSYIVDARVQKVFSKLPRVFVTITDITDTRDHWTTK